MIYYVYILTSNDNKTLYVGVTNDLRRRVYEHKNELIDGFTKRYHIHKLVYFEQTSDIYSAINREKQIKGWIRKKKDELIVSSNPRWEEIELSF